MKVKSNRIKTELLRSLRNAKGISSYEAGRALGMPQSTYFGIEKGARGCSIENAKKIASFYGIDWASLYE